MKTCKICGQPHDGVHVNFTVAERPPHQPSGFPNAGRRGKYDVPYRDVRILIYRGQP